MQKYILASLVLLSCLFSSLFAQNTIPLLTGTYQMTGSNSNANIVNYRGQVIIEPFGSNYKLRWKIGKSQSQTGIAILKDHILSVAFYDQNQRMSGVVSYTITGNGQLEGIWAVYNSHRLEENG